MKIFTKILAYICLLFPFVFYFITRYFREFALSLPQPFSDFRSAPVFLWQLIALPILLAIILFTISHFIKSKNKKSPK